MNPTIKLLLKQFTSPIVLILIAATVVSMLVGDVTDGVIILAIIVPSGLLSFWQEHRANQTMKALMQRVQVQVEVMRGGVEVTVPISELVLGDVVLLRIGDVVPGDLKLTASAGLQIDESALTGESLAVDKAVGDKALFGTAVAAGTGTGVVEQLGAGTEYGAMAAAIAGKEVTTSFERGMTRFGLLLMRAMLLLLGGLFIMNLILQRPIIDSLLFSIALAVGLTPQLLPAIISVSLSTGARMMAKRQVLVKRLDAIEDFGAMNVLCTDKTGTLTAGVVALDGAIDLQGAASERVGRLAFLNASLQSGFKNPLDEAIVASGDSGTSGSDLGTGFGAAKLISEIPYDFERKRLSVLVEDAGQKFLITKGAFENVLAVCAIGDAERAAAQKRFEDLSAQGYRVVAVATGAAAASQTGGAELEADLKLEGLLLFMDPPKQDAAAEIEQLAAQGIQMILITGDNAFVAKAVAGKVGIANEVVLTGAEIAELTEAQLVERTRDCRVFAAVNPVQKQKIVLALRAAGNTVGFFGDGINDAAAIHAADVGISVDTAVDVAKHAAAIVLLNKNLTVISDGVALGRKTFINTMKYVRVGVSAAFGNMLSMAVAAVFLPFLPLLPVQILLLNFMTDFPALSIAQDSVDDEAVQKPRAWDIKNIRNFMLVFGLISSVFDILTFVILRAGFNAHAELFRSGWFIESTLTELAVMLVLRTRRHFWKSRPGTLLWVSSVILAVLVVVIPFTGIGVALQLEPLPLPLLLSLFGLIAVYVAINELAKRRFMRD